MYSDSSSAAIESREKRLPFQITSLQIPSPSRNITGPAFLSVIMAWMTPSLQAQPQSQGQQGAGGADRIPPGITAPPDIIPDEVDPLSPGMGSSNTLAAGQPEPTDLQPFTEAPPYGSVGLNTTVPPTAGGGSGAAMPVAISTIGFGLQNDPQAQQALTDVANAGGGQSYDAQNLNQLTTAFSQAIAQAPMTGGGGGIAYSSGRIPDWAWVLVIFSAVFLMILAIIVVVSRRKKVPTAQTGAILANLDIYYKDGTSLRVPITSTRITIGRGATNNVVLADPSSSGTHAEITISEKGYLLRVLGSSYGTFVNSKQVTEAYLNSGDTITLGSTQLVLR